MNELLRTYGAIIYCTIVTLSFSFSVAALYVPWLSIRADMRDIALVLIGALIASFKDVGNFFTGSTASSQKKDEQIATMAKDAATKVP